MSKLSQRDLGYQAYMDGESQDKNPNRYGSDDWNEWNEGFEQAKAEDDGSGPL